MYLYMIIIGSHVHSIRPLTASHPPPCSCVNPIATPARSRNVPSPTSPSGPALVQGLRTLLKGGVAAAQPAAAFDIVRSLPHGHVAAVLGTLRKLRLDRTLARAALCATRPGVGPHHRTHPQPPGKIGHRPWPGARRQGAASCRSSSACCATPKGVPVAVEVFDGNTADPATVGVQVDKLRRRFGWSRVVLVGDRGMLTEARIRDEIEPAGLNWISALRGPAIRALVESGEVQLSLFDQLNLIEIRSPEYPRRTADGVPQSVAGRGAQTHGNRLAGAQFPHPARRPGHPRS